MFNPFAPTVNGAVSGLKKALDNLKKVQQHHSTKAKEASQQAAIHALKALNHEDEANEAKAIHTNISGLLTTNVKAK